MAAHPTWEGLGQGMLVLAAVWWAWAGYAWLTNALHSDDGIARVGLLSAMAAMLIAALAVPEAFGEDSVVFGFAYFAVRAIHIVVYACGVEDIDIRGAILGLAPGLLAAPALIVIAGFLDGGAAAGLWIVALLIDYGTPYVQDMSGFTVAPTHFHERFGLIVIIALGESIVATGTGLASTGLTAGVVAAAIGGLVIAACQWWAYFDVVALVAGRRFAELDRLERTRVSRDSYGVLHLLLIAGVVLVALGLKKALLHVDAPLDTVPAVALCGGAALYLVGHVAIRLRNLGTINRQRLFTAVILLALIPFATSVDALVAVLAVADRPRCADRLRDDPLPRRAPADPPSGRRLGDDGPAGRRRIGSADARARVLGPAPRPRPGRARWSSCAGDADVVIGAGDFASIHEGLEETIDALAAIEAPTVLVPGNNETEDALREATADWAGGDRAPRRGHRDRRGRVLRPRRRGPGHAVGLELRPLRRGGRRAAGRLPRGRGARRPLAAARARRHARAAATTSAARRSSRRSRPSGRASPSAATSTRAGAPSRPLGPTRIVNLGPTGTWFDV